MKPTPIREAVSVREAAAVLNVCPKTIRTMLRRGELAGFQVGRVFRVCRRELIVYREVHRLDR